MIDSEGYRPNVGIVICNRLGELLWAKRIGQAGWQFPQGGVKESESLEQALYRELDEEVGLDEKDVRILHQTTEWLHYRLPENYIRYQSDPLCVGQKQKWFLLEYFGDDQNINIKTKIPEFKKWSWSTKEKMLKLIVPFKRKLYKEIVSEFKEFL